MHKNYSIEKLLCGFCEELIFIFKTIIRLSPSDIPDYDMYIKILKFDATKLKGANTESTIKYEWEDKLKKEYANFSNFIIKKDDFLKISFLIKGYSFNFEQFLALFEEKNNH